MYKLTLMLFFVLNFQISNSQILKIFIDNLKNEHDTVIIGFKENASIGIDENIGEKEISELEKNNSLFYILQRDSSHYNCINSSYPEYRKIYFKNNFDSKINLRNGTDKDFEYFEILNLNPADKLNITFTSDYPLQDIAEYFEYDTKNCVDLKDRINFNNSKSYVFLTNKPIYSLNIRIKRIPVSVIPQVADKNYIILPDRIIFSSNTIKIELIDLSGKLAKQTKDSEIYIQNLTKGCYFIKYLNKNGENGVIKIII